MLFSNMKKNNKVLLIIMSTSIVILLSSFSLTFYFIYDLVNKFQLDNMNLGLRCSESANEVLVSQTEVYLKEIVNAKAKLVNNIFHEIGNDLKEYVAFVDELYSGRNKSTDNFSQRKVLTQQEATEGVWCSKYQLVRGVSMTSHIQNEIQMFAKSEYMLAPTVKNNPVIDSIYVGTEEGMAYIYDDQRQDMSDWDPRNRPWYQEAMQHPDKPVWLPTYLDPFGNTLLTVAHTINNGEGKINGVVGVDVLLTDLVNLIQSTKIGENGTTFILNDKLDFVVHKDMGEAGFSQSLEHHIANVQAFRDAVSHETDDTAENNHVGIIRMGYEGEDSYIAYSGIPETNWLFCVAIPTKEVSLPALKARQQANDLIETFQHDMQSKLMTFLRVFIVLFAAVGIFAITFSFYFGSQVSGTVKKDSNKDKNCIDKNIPNQN